MLGGNFRSIWSFSFCNKTSFGTKRIGSAKTNRVKKKGKKKEMSIKPNQWLYGAFDFLLAGLSAGTGVHCHVRVDLQHYILVFIKEQDAEWGHLFWHTARLGNSRDDPHCSHYTLNGRMIWWLQRLEREIRATCQVKLFSPRPYYIKKKKKKKKDLFEQF